MTFSLGASGTVETVKNTLVSQAEQYEDALANHVKDLLHKVLDTLDAPHGVSVSASGHTGPSNVTVNANVSLQPDPNPPTTPPADPAPVS